MSATINQLNEAIGKQALGVASYYRAQQLKAGVCCVFVHPNNNLHCAFPAGHQLQIGDLVTIHLDNRTGVSEYDAELSVYRSSPSIVHPIKVVSTEFNMT
jgi:hypothetical protein